MACLVNDDVSFALTYLESHAVADAPIHLRLWYLHDSSGTVEMHVRSGPHLELVPSAIYACSRLQLIEALQPTFQVPVSVLGDGA